jgi:hypothetical protein
MKEIVHSLRLLQLEVALNLGLQALFGNIQDWKEQIKIIGSQYYERLCSKSCDYQISS